MTDMIYLDIDGTLRDEQKGIPDSAVRAISQCRRKGIRVVICTGRNPGSIQDDVMALPTDGVISGGGCYLQYHGIDCWKKHFSMSTIEYAADIASKRKLYLALEAEWKIYMDYHASLFYRKDVQRKNDGRNVHDRRHDLLRNKIAYEDNFQELWSEKQMIHKICIIGDRGAVEEAEAGMTEEAEIVQKRMWNEQWYLELLPKGCHKGAAVKWLNHKLGIPKKRTMCFGDSENDIAMMKASGIAVAVGSSSPAVIKYASSVCEAVMEDGIYKELVRRNIIEGDTISGDRRGSVNEDKNRKGSGR